MASKFIKGKKLIITGIAVFLALAVTIVSVFILPSFFEDDDDTNKPKKPSSSQNNKNEDDDQSNENPFDEFEDEFSGIEDWEDTNNYDDEVEIPVLGNSYYFDNFDSYEKSKNGEEIYGWRVYPDGDDMFFLLDNTEVRSGKYSGKVVYKSKNIGWGGTYISLANEDWSKKDSFGFWLKGNSQSNRAGVTVRITTKNIYKNIVVTADADEWQYFSYNLRKDLGFTDSDLKCVTEILITLGGDSSLPIYFDDLGVYDSKDGSPAATPVTKLDFENTGKNVGDSLEFGSVLESGNAMSVTLEKENSGNHYAKIEYSTTSDLAWTGTVIPVNKENWQILSQMQMRIKTDGSRQLVKMGFYGKTNLYEYTFYADSADWTDVAAAWRLFKGSGAKNLADVEAISLMFAAKEAGDYALYIDDVTAAYLEAITTDIIDNYENYPEYQGEKDNFDVNFGSGENNENSGDGTIVSTQILYDFENLSGVTFSNNVTIVENSFNGTNALRINTIKNASSPSYGIGTAEITFNQPINLISNTITIDVTNVFRTDIFRLELYKGDKLVGASKVQMPSPENTIYTNRSMVHTLVFRFDATAENELKANECIGITKIAITANPYKNKAPVIDNIRVSNDTAEEGVLVNVDSSSQIRTYSGFEYISATNSFNGTAALKLSFGGSKWQTTNYSAIYFTKNQTIAGNRISFDVSGAMNQQYFEIKLVDNNLNALATIKKYTGSDPHTVMPDGTITWEFTDLTDAEMSKVRGIVIGTCTWNSGVNPIIDNIRFTSADVEEEEENLGDVLFEMENWVKSEEYSGGIAANITKNSAHSGEYGVIIKLDSGAGKTAGYDVTLPRPIDITEYNQISLWIKGDNIVARQGVSLQIIGDYGTAISYEYDLKTNGEWKNIVFDYSDLSLTGRIAGRVIGYRLIFKQYDAVRTLYIDDITLKKAIVADVTDKEMLNDFEKEDSIKNFVVNEKNADGIKIERTNAEKYSGSYSAKVTVPAKSTQNSYYSAAGITEYYSPNIDGMYSGNCFKFRVKGDAIKETIKLKLIIECGKKTAESTWITVNSTGGWVDITRSYVQIGLSEKLSERIYGITILAELDDVERTFYIDDIRVDTTARVGAFITDVIDEFEVVTPEYVYGTEVVGSGGKYDTCVSGTGWMGSGSSTAAIIQGTNKGASGAWYGIKRYFNYPFDIWGEGNFNNVSVNIATHAIDDNLKVRLTIFTEDAESYSVIYDVGKTESASKFKLLFALDDFGFTDKQFKEITGYKFEMLLDDTFQAVYFDAIKMVE